ncbi:MAG: Flagellin N-methylase [Verrucomicrobiales bacterium]|nr:Flagellin N-methylase [Verrucomicrobiales bacterium]
MPDSLQDITTAVHQSTLRTLQAAWPDRETGSALMDLTEASLNHLGETLTGFTQIAGLKTACAAGCFFCCYLQVDVRAHEVFLILRWLDKNWTAEAVGALLVDARRVRARALTEESPSHSAIAGAPGDPGQPPALREEAQPTPRQPCVFLRNGHCSIYPVRPGACRRYSSASLEACGDLYEGIEPTQGIQFPVLKEAGRAAGTAIHNTFIAKGYDGFSYQLPLAIASALEDPSCWERWLKKEKAFPASAESTVPSHLHFSQSESLTQLQAALRSPAPARVTSAPAGEPAPVPAAAGESPPTPASEVVKTLPPQPVSPVATSRTWNQSLSATSPPQGNPAQKKPPTSA